MTTENNQPVPEGVVQNPEVTKAEIALSLSKEGLAYQSILQEGNNIALTRDNLESEKPKFDLLVKVEKELKDLENPFTSRWKSWNEARQSLLKPVSELVTKNRSTLTKIANEIAAEKKKAEDEAARVKAIKDAMDTFKTMYAGKIAASKDIDELVGFERIINLETGNARKYQEFLPEMVESCKAIRSLLTAQKSKLRELSELERKEQEASENGSDEQVLEIIDQREALKSEITQKAIEIQETALNQSTKADIPIEPEVILPNISIKRKTWTWEITDINLLAKKMPHLIKLVPEDEKIDELLKSKRGDKSLDGKEEENYFGIRFFLKKTY